MTKKIGAGEADILQKTFVRKQIPSNWRKLEKQIEEELANIRK